MNHKSAENRLEEEEKKLERGAIDVRVKDIEMTRMKTTREWVKWVMGDGKGMVCVWREKTVWRSKVKQIWWIWQEGRRGSGRS